MTLNNQRAIFTKTNLGFKSQNKQKFLKNFFVKASSTPSNITYFYYKNVGHKVYTCDFRKMNKNKIKILWVPNGTIFTNPK